MAQTSITLGHISGVFGIQGWIKLNSYTEPEKNIFRLKNWVLTSPKNKTPKLVSVQAFQAHQKAWVVKFFECHNRDDALLLRGSLINILREQLPPLQDTYYWVDLEGLHVLNEANHSLGYVDHLFATGANDVLVVKNQGKIHYIPYVRPNIVKHIDLAAGTMRVDWDENP